MFAGNANFSEKMLLITFFSTVFCLLPTGGKRILPPIPKAQPSRSITTDIHPISLTPDVSKILESFIGNIILEHIKERMDTNQYGALTGLSTTHALVDLLHDVHEFIHNGYSARIASLIIPRRSI